MRPYVDVAFLSRNWTCRIRNFVKDFLNSLAEFITKLFDILDLLVVRLLLLVLIILGALSLIRQHS